MLASAITTTSPPLPGAVEEWTRGVTGMRGYRDGGVGGDDGSSARHRQNAGGGVEVVARTRDGKTEVEILSREWDIQATSFLDKI